MDVCRSLASAPQEAKCLVLLGAGRGVLQGFRRPATQVGAPALILLLYECREGAPCREQYLVRRTARRRRTSKNFARTATNFQQRGRPYLFAGHPAKLDQLLW